MLFPSNLNNTKYIDVYNNGKFKLKNFYPQKGEFLTFTTFSKSGKAKKPKIYLNIPNTIRKDVVTINSKFSIKSSFYKKNEIPINFLKESKREQLDEVVLEARLDRVYKKRGPKFSGSVIKIDDHKARSYKTIADLFETEKFIVQRGNGGLQQTICRRGNCSSDLKDPPPDLAIISREKGSSGSPRPVFFFVEGRRIENMNRFLMTGTLEYEDVYVDYSNNIIFTRKGRPAKEAIIVNLFLRRSAFKSEDLNNNRSKNIEVKYGFEPNKEFYAPGYVSYNIQPYLDYGIIHWEPEVLLTKNEKFNIKSAYTDLDKISFFIEGMTSNGKLISQLIKLNDTNKKASN